MSQNVRAPQAGFALRSSDGIDIGSVQQRDKNDNVYTPLAESTWLNSVNASNEVLMDITADSVGLFKTSDFTEVRDVRELQNETGLTSGQATDDTTGSSLPANAIPDGSTVRVQALQGNTSPVLVDGSFELVEGQAVDLGVDDTSKISFTAQSSGDGVCFIVES